MQMDIDNRTIGVVVADDHPVVRMGLRSLLQAESAFTVLGEARDGHEALEIAKRLTPDILVLDLDMPRMAGMDVLRQLIASGDSTRVILLTAAIDQKQMVDSLQLGARGIVMKDSAAHDLVHAIRAVNSGQYWLWNGGVQNLVSALQEALRGENKLYGLTSRELQIVGAVVNGESNKGIAELLSISEATVKTHLSHIFDKLGVSSRLELGMFAMNHKLVPDC
jgi:two-component system, NarL family, nitrate/nitrite response regulator NarL